MAETITYRVSMSPRIETVSESSKDGEYSNEVILDTTNYDAIATLFDEIKAGTDVSSVVSAIGNL